MRNTWGVFLPATDVSLETRKQIQMVVPRSGSFRIRRLWTGTASQAELHLLLRESHRRPKAPAPIHKPCGSTSQYEISVHCKKWCIAPTLNWGGECNWVESWTNMNCIKMVHEKWVLVGWSAGWEFGFVVLSCFLRCMVKGGWLCGIFESQFSSRVDHQPVESCAYSPC